MLLLRSACIAFLGGHAFESVSSIAAGLERSYEFFIRVACRKKTLNPEVMSRTWKMVARQSERQFGAFCFLYALETCRPFNLSNHISEFRNRVIHQGYIPSREEVVDFGNQVFDKIHDISRAVEKLGDEYVQAEEQDNLNAQENEIPEGMDWVSLKVTTVKINEKNEVVGFPETFVELLQAMKKRFGD